jgi:Toprim-like/CHC2 zinc finger
MQSHILTCRDAKQKDLVEYLASLGHQPQKIRGEDHWYLSPLREEKTASFKVNKKFNVWYDHGMGKGGNLIDFGILYHKCSVQELLQKLNGSPSFHQQNPFSSGQNSQLNKDPGREKGKILILAETDIQSPALIHYLETRNILVELAEKYCRQVEFELYGKRIIALGFPNRSGGYELRNANFKGSNSPKDLSFLDNDSSTVAVFEGFFSFLSFQQLNEQEKEDLTNFLALNTLAFLEKSRPLMEQHGQIQLYLDRDDAGIRATEKALKWDRKYIDRSSFYAGYKDVNEWLKGQAREHRQGHRMGRHF